MCNKDTIKHRQFVIYNIIYDIYIYILTMKCMYKYKQFNVHVYISSCVLQVLSLAYTNAIINLFQYKL